MDTSGIRCTQGWMDVLHRMGETMFRSKRCRQCHQTACNPTQCLWSCNLSSDQGCLDTTSTQWRHFRYPSRENDQAFSADSFRDRSTLLLQQSDLSSTQISVNLRRVEHCNYGEMLNQMLRDCLVCGITNEKWQQCLLSEDRLTYIEGGAQHSQTPHTRQDHQPHPEGMHAQHATVAVVPTPFLKAGGVPLLPQARAHCLNVSTESQATAQGTEVWYYIKWHTRWQGLRRLISQNTPFTISVFQIVVRCSWSCKYIIYWYKTAHLHRREGLC